MIGVNPGSAGVVSLHGLAVRGASTGASVGIEVNSGRAVTGTTVANNRIGVYAGGRLATRCGLSTPVVEHSLGAGDHGVAVGVDCPVHRVGTACRAGTTWPICTPSTRLGKRLGTLRAERGVHFLN